MTTQLRRVKQVIRGYLQTFSPELLIPLLEDARVGKVPYDDPCCCLVGHRYPGECGHISTDSQASDAYLILADPLAFNPAEDTLRCTRLVPMILSEIRRRESLKRKDYQTAIDIEMEMEMIPCN